MAETAGSDYESKVAGTLPSGRGSRVLNEREQISRLQAVFVVVGALGATGTIMLGHHSLWRTGRDAWPAFIVGTAAALLIAAPVAGVGVCFPGRTLAEAARRGLGRFLGGAVGLFYALYFLLAAVLTLRMAIEGVGFSLPRTPPVVLSILLAIPMLYTAVAGLQVIARVSVVLLSVLTFLGIILSVLAIPVSDYALLFPLFEHGFRPALTGAFVTFGFLGEMSVLATLQGRVQGGASFRVNALLLLFFFLVTIGHITGPLAVFGPEMLGEGPGGITMPILAELKVLSIPDLLERLDSIGILVKLMAIFLKMPVFLYAAAVEAAYVLSVRQYRTLLPPAGAALITLPVLAFSNTPQAEAFLTGVYPVLGIVAGVGLPALLLVAAVPRGGRFRRARRRLAA